MKKYISILAVVFSLCCLFLGTQYTYAYAESANDVVIDEAHFPDEAFRKLAAKFDQNGDGLLSTFELQSATEINLFWTSVNSLQGIEYFQSLVSLDCTGGNIAPFDLSRLPNLKVLNCAFNNWESLNLTGCQSLEELNCRGCRLQKLIVAACPNLRVLNCQNNLLKELDVSGCSALQELNCANNQISSLVLDGCFSLSNLNCSANCLRSLDLSQAVNLQSLCCNFNRLPALQAAACPALVTLDCIGNNMSQLTLGALPNLKNLFCGCNVLTALDVRGCPSLEKVNCCYNQLEHLDISACPTLAELVSTAGSVRYGLSPSVVTYTNGFINTSFVYSLETDAEKKLTLDTKVRLNPDLYKPVPETSCLLLSSDPEGWGMPAVALEYWHILSVRAQGAETLNYLDTLSGDDYPYRYYLYDIDKDQTPELIVEGSGAEANRAGYVFTAEDGHAVYVGSIYMGHTTLCTFPSGNGLLRYNAHMGVMSINKIVLKDCRLEETELVPVTDGFTSSYDYPSVSSLIPGSAALTYNCSVRNPILFRTWQSAVKWLETGEQYRFPSISWPEGNEQFYSSVINSNQFVTIRGVTSREGASLYAPLSSLLDYNVNTYWGPSDITHYDLFPGELMYNDFNNDGTMDCLLLLSDSDGKMSIPLVLSYNGGTVYAYIQENLASQVIDLKLDDGGGLEFELQPYSDAPASWRPVKLLFYNDCFLHLQSE